MKIAATLLTAFGWRLATEPPTPSRLAAAARAAPARQLDREADLTLSAGDYRAADALSWARATGRAVLIETNTDHAEEWEAIFSGKPTLIWPSNGIHPIPPAASEMH